MKYNAWAVIDKYGNGYSVRHGQKDLPSVYEHKHNADAFVARVLLSKKKQLFVVPCVVTYELI